MKKPIATSVAIAAAFTAGLLRGQTKPAGPAASPEAKALLDKFAQAVGKLDSFQSAGTILTELSAGGNARREAKNFVTRFRSTSEFRHEIAREIVIGANGEKIYGFRPDQRKYIQEKVAESYARSDDLPGFVSEVLAAQDPVLLARLTAAPGQELMRGATSVEATSDNAIVGQFASGEKRTVEFDPATGLPTRITIDFSEVLKTRGTPNVEKAQTVISYARIQAVAPAPADAFAWVPPDDATDAAKPAAGGGAAETSALVGKPAPDFTLKDLDGKDVKLSALKGSVVVLDFWATWCGPCRAGLPYIDKLHADFSPRGAKVYGVNQQESLDDVNKFRAQMKLAMPMLLDSDGKVGGLYGVTGIPTTVVIGKDGTIRKVNIGFDPSEIDALRKEVLAAIDVP